MKKIVKRISIGIGILVIILVIIGGGFYFKMKSELKKMNVVATKEVVHNIYAVNDSFVNMFLVKDSTNYVAIDAGNDIKVIARELKKLNIDPEKITAVLLTHTDGDHVAALKLFSNAKVYLSKEEEQMINGKTARMLNRHNQIDTKTYTLLDDQQNIQIGNIHIQGILTPGHTPGSMSYLINGKYLFVGDAFGLKDGKVDKPNQIFTKDMETAIKSFGKINNLPGTEYIFTAHTGFSNDYKNAVKTELK
jgi:glyoxylase-like metal-dependent hydrolase (beta-lactamase superfamily II)